MNSGNHWMQALMPDLSSFRIADLVDPDRSHEFSGKTEKEDFVMSRLSSLAAVVVLFAIKLSAQICDVSPFPATDPCLVTGTYTVLDGCTLNFGNRSVILQAATFNVQNVTIQCARLQINAGSTINCTAAGGNVVISCLAAGANDGSVTIAGQIDLNDPTTGGDLTITATGPISVTGTGTVLARGTGGLGDGGTVTMTSQTGNISINGAATSINVSSGADAAGGQVTLTSATGLIAVSRRIDADGGSFDGGYITLDAATNVSTSGVLTANGGGSSALGFGWGGYIDVFAQTGSISIQANITANGPTGTIADGGGDGGAIYLDAATDITLAADCRAEGGVDGYGGYFTAIAGGLLTQSAGFQNSVRDIASDGSGGSLSISAGTVIVLSGDNLAEGATTSFGYGGDVTVVAGADAIVQGILRASGNTAGSVDVTGVAGQVLQNGRIECDGRGTDGWGGNVTLTSNLDMDLASSLTDVKGSNANGLGGSIVITSGLRITASATTDIVAAGNGSNGASAGSIDITGCRITFPTGSTINARGTSGGTIAIVDSDIFACAGSLRADTGGTVSITTRIDAPISPNLAGAVLNPLPTVTNDGTMPPCLAKGRVTLTAPSPVTIGAGETIQISVQSSSPVAPIWVLANVFPFAESFTNYGYPSLGYSQLPLATSFYLANPFPGLFGQGATGNDVTDPLGAWFYDSGALPPILAGLTVFVECYVIDVAAINGIFDQPEMITIALQ